MSCIRFGTGIVHQTRVLPQHNANASRFFCEPLKCTLTFSACAARFETAATHAFDERWKASCCRGCSVGKQNKESSHAH